MGEFDDVLAMEPGDEWDNHLVGADEKPRAVLADLAAMLQLPNATVDLRGDVPADVVDVLGDLANDDLVLLGEGVSITLTVRSVADGWVIDDLEQGELATGSGPDELLTSLLELLDRLALQTDPMRLHLDAACVELDGVGILITEATPDLVSVGTIRPRSGARSVSDDRVTVAADLLERGADYLSTDLLTLLPGSRTVFAHPIPPSTSEYPPTRASSVAAVRAATRIDQIVLLQHEPGARAGVADLEPAVALLQLLHRARDLDRMGSAALDVVASVVSGARCASVTYSDADDVAGLIESLAPLSGSRLTVLHRFDETPVSGSEHETSMFDGDGTDGTRGDVTTPTPAAVVRGHSSLRVVRFDEGGALFDGVSRVGVVLTPNEIDALELLLVKLPKDRSSTVSGDALDRVRGAGIGLPLGIHARDVPGVESFGLPNCPAGGAARAMWGGEPDGRIVKASGTPSSEVVPGAIAQAITRDLVSASDEERQSILRRHEEARRDVAAIESTLDEVLEQAEAHDIVPLVLGGAILAHDGLLPADFTDAEQIDLLISADELDQLAEVLDRAGFDRVLPSVADEPDRDVGHELVRAGTPSVTVLLHSRLAVGPFGALVNHDEFHGRSVPVRLGSGWCRALHPEDRFVLTCVQLDLDAKHSSVQDIRDVVLSAPRVEALMAESLEASERWGATTSVIASIRRVQGVMPGLSPWLIERSSRYEGRNRRKIEKQDKKPRRGLLRSRRH